MSGVAVRLQRAATREARVQDEITEVFAGELEQVLVLLNVRIRELLAQLARKNGRLVSTEANLGRALQMRQDIQAALEQAGFRELVMDAVDLPLDRVTSAVLEGSGIAGRAARLSAFDLEALAAFKELRLAELLDIEADAAAAVWRAVLDGVLGARPYDALVQDVEDVLEQSAAEARTVYDTAVSTYSRQVDQLHATGEPDELFLYVGPADKKTRPFCRTHVGRVYARREIEEFDNGQLPNVFLTGGGYNCRHAWKRVSVLDDELRTLHTTGGRLPLVESQLQQTGGAAR